MDISNLVIGNSEAEARVIAAIVSNVLQYEDKCQKKGSFVLGSTVDGSDVFFEIVSYDLKKGALLFDGSDSRRIAESIVQNDTLTSYLTEVEVIHEDLGRRYMALFASNNMRYICAFICEEAGEEVYVYAAVAKALSLMYDDEELRDSTARLFIEELEDHPGILALEEYVEKLFNEAKLPAIRDWKASL